MTPELPPWLVPWKETIVAVAAILAIVVSVYRKFAPKTTRESTITVSSVAHSLARAIEDARISEQRAEAALRAARRSRQDILDLCKRIIDAPTPPDDLSWAAIKAIAEKTLKDVQEEQEHLNGPV